MKANFGLSGRCSSSPCPQRGWGLCCADSIFGELPWIFWNWKMGLRKKCPQKWRGYCPTFKVVVQPQVFCLRLDFTRNHTGKRHPCLTYVYIYMYAQYIYVSLSLCMYIWFAHIFFPMLTEDIKSSYLYYTTSSPNVVRWKVAAFAVEVLRGQVRLGWAMPEAVGRPGRRGVAVFFLVRCTSQFTIHLRVGDE